MTSKLNRISLSTVALLVVFVVAFLSQSLSAFGASNNNSFSNTHHPGKHFYSHADVVNSFSNDLIENETEDDTDWLDFTLPIHFFQSQVDSKKLLQTTDGHLYEEPTNPIYIWVCNFRI